MFYLLLVLFALATNICGLHKMPTFAGAKQDFLMQQLTVYIPDNKVAFFIDLAHNLGFVVENTLPEPILTAQQIELVNEARKKITGQPEEFSDWEEATVPGSLML